MPSISGPRSTAASNFTVTPFVSGATCSLLIVLSSLYFQGPTFTLSARRSRSAEARMTSSIVDHHKHRQGEKDDDDHQRSCRNNELIPLLASYIQKRLTYRNARECPQHIPIRSRSEERR